MFSKYSEDNLPDGWKIVGGADFVDSEDGGESWWMFVLQDPDGDTYNCQDWHEASDKIDSYLDEKSRTS